MQPQTSRDARNQELRDGPRRMFLLLRGTDSAMTCTLTQATSKDGKEAGVELVEPPLESKPGERVYFEGAEFESTSARTLRV